MKLRNAALVSAPFLLACIGPFGREDPSVVAPSPGVAPIFDSPTDSPVDSPVDSDEPQTDLVVSDNPEGDVSCFDGSLDAHVLTAGEDATFTARIMDFEYDEPVADATVALVHDGEALTAGVTDGGGFVSLTAPTCAVLEAEIATAPELDQTVPTTVSFVSDGSDRVLPSISKTTWALIPSLLGISADSEKGHVWGRVVDCNGAPLDHVEVRLGEATPKYFLQDFPNRDQQWTSEDGRFVLVNAEPTDGTVSAWIWRDEAHIVIAQAEVSPEPGEITLIELQVGIDGAALAPDDCL